jgi:hypothetical protein
MNNNIRSPSPNVGFLNTATNAFGQAVNAVGNVADQAVNVVNNAAETIGNVAGNVANQTTNVFGQVANQAVNVVNNAAKNVGMGNILNAKNIIPVNNSYSSNSGDAFGFSWLQIALMAFLIIGFILIAVFYKEITTYFEGVFKPSAPAPAMPPTTAPPASVEETAAEKGGAPASAVERLLPGRKEVFNVSQNKYSYYDAQALCKSLGSELATYDQVREAYNQGADWCNYGWVEGQMAVFPTQETTWEKLQQGPEDQRTSCGRPGLNGGYFDNPELQFGVTCFGIKPNQSKHDASAIAAGQSAPLSAGALALEKKVASFRGANTPIMPWSSAKWSQ